MMNQSPKDTTGDSIVESARPLIIWTWRRSGGTNLAKALLDTRLGPVIEHEPFNINRRYGHVTTHWKEHGDLDHMREAILGILARGESMKHCLEIPPQNLNRLLLRMSTQHGYRHVFLYRRNATDRLLSLHYAQQTGIWGPEDRSRITLDGSEFGESLDVKHLIKHERACRQHMRSLYRTLCKMGEDPMVVCFEELYQSSTDQAVQLVKDLFRKITGGEVSYHDDFYTGILASGNQGTKSDYHKFKGSERLAAAAEGLGSFRLLVRPLVEADIQPAPPGVRHFMAWKPRPAVSRNSAYLSGVFLPETDEDTERLEMLVDGKAVPLHTRLPSPQVGRQHPEVEGARACRFQSGMVPMSAVCELVLARNEERLTLATWRMASAGAQELLVFPAVGSRIGYFNIPKVASTSIKKALYGAEEKRPFLGEDQDRNAHQWFSKKRKKVNSDACDFTFVVLRDPVKRFLSGYSNRVGHHRELSENYIRGKHPELIDELPAFNPDLDQFIAQFDRYLQVSTIRHHFEPVSNLLTRKQLDRFDRIYRIEDLGELEKDLSRLLEDDIKLTKAQTGGKKVHISSLPREQVERLIDLFRQDYELMEGIYSTETLWKEWTGD